MRRKTIVTLCLALAGLLLLAAGGSLAAQDEAKTCTWVTPTDVQGICSRRCGGHQDPEACRQRCPSAVDAYRPWTEKDCNYMTQGTCVGELAKLQDAEPTEAGKLAFALVISHGCLGRPE